MGYKNLYTHKRKEMHFARKRQAIIDDHNNFGFIFMPQDEVVLLVFTDKDAR